MSRLKSSRTVSTPSSFPTNDRIVEALQALARRRVEQGRGGETFGSLDDVDSLDTLTELGYADVAAVM